MLAHEATGQQSFSCQKRDPIVLGRCLLKCSAPTLIASACSTWLRYTNEAKSLGSGYQRSMYVKMRSLPPWFFWWSCIVVERISKSSGFANERIVPISGKDWNPYSDMNRGNWCVYSSIGARACHPFQ